MGGGGGEGRDGWEGLGGGATVTQPEGGAGRGYRHPARGRWGEGLPSPSQREVRGGGRGGGLLSHHLSG